MSGEAVPPLTSMQVARTTLIAMHVRNCLEELHGGGSRLDFTDSGGEYRGLTDEQMALINPIVRNAVADILHALDHPELSAARKLISFTGMLVPDYWEQPELTDSYRELFDVIADEAVSCRHCARRIFEIGDRWFHRSDDGGRFRGCRAASFDDDSGWDDTLDRRWMAAPPR
jgi:hypothetical protein